MLCCCAEWSHISQIEYAYSSNIFNVLHKALSSWSSPPLPHLWCSFRLFPSCSIFSIKLNQFVVVWNWFVLKLFCFRFSLLKNDNKINPLHTKLLILLIIRNIFVWPIKKKGKEQKIYYFVSDFPLSWLLSTNTIWIKDHWH